MGRGQTIAIASEEYLDPALYQEFEAVGPRTYEWYNFFGTVDDPTFGDIGSHGASVFIKAVPGALGARGTTDIQSWRSAFSSAIRAWIVAQNGGETTPFLSSWQPPDVVNYSSVTGMSRAMEHWIDEYDGVLAIAAGNGGRVPGGNGGYNAISVGASPRTWDRLETSHITQDNPSFGSPGRSKPDIVVSNGNVFTSFQAPVITAYVARLREAAVCYHTSTTDALRSETLKAVLLAGADQTIAFDDTDWTWTRTTEFPIDRRFGAGTADIHESFLIVREGESDAVSIDSSPPAGWSTIGSSPARGWDYIAELEANSSVALAIPGGAASVNLAATWPYEVTNLVTFAEGRVADINLEVFGVADGCEAVSVQQSRSPIDNVEYPRSLSRGRQNPAAPCCNQARVRALPKHHSARSPATTSSMSAMHWRLRSTWPVSESRLPPVRFQIRQRASCSIEPTSMSTAPSMVMMQRSCLRASWAASASCARRSPRAQGW